MKTRTTTASQRDQGIVSGACLTPWGEPARGLPGATQTELPPLTGFVVSRFSPLVAEVVRCCLDGHDVAGARTAVLLGSIAGDATTADTAAHDLARGDVHNPLLFFQSVPSSVLGALAKEYGITGPMTCLSAREDLPRHLLDTAAVLLADGQVERVLVTAVELAPQPRTRQVFAELAEAGSAVRAPRGDFAVALLLDGPVRQLTSDGDPAELGYLAPLAALCPTTVEEAI